MNAPRDGFEPFTLDQRFTLEAGPVYLTGTQALLRVLLDQRRADQRRGLNTAGFVCGYPGSPVGGVDGVMDAHRALLAQHHIVHRQGLNEELAATAAFGTQAVREVPGARYDGVFAMWFGKAPGVDRTGDAFHHHNFRGVAQHGGVLAVAGDDPHARSTIFPSDSNAAFYKFFMPVLAPGNVQEVLDFGLHGYALSRSAGLWVGLKFVTDVADSAATAWVDPARVQPVLPEVLFDGQVMRPGRHFNEAGPPLIEAERRIAYGQLQIARRYAALNGLNRIVVRPSQPRIGLLSGGKTYYDLRQALEDLGLDEAALHAKGIAILKMGMLYPVEPEIVREFAQGLDEIVVVEDKRPFLELFVKDILYGLPERPRVVGKTDPDGQDLLPLHGELSPDVIARALLRRLGPLVDSVAGLRRAQHLAAPPRAPVVLGTSRLPYFCSGCPHNTGLKLPEGSIVGAGIGCHIMTLWMGPRFGRVLGYTQMGGEGAQWVGLAPFTDTAHFFQNLGDGTFAHSGSLALRFAVATRTPVTYKLLFNSTVAMTGGQDIQGGMSVPDVVKWLEAEGVARILITTDEPGRYPGRKVGSAEVWPRERILEAEQQLAATPGVTVLLHDQQCATEKRRLRKRGQLAYRPRSAFINQRVCEGCGDCGEKSNCLSVQPVATEFGRKTEIHQSSCNQDLSCLQGDCPSFVTVELPGGRPVRPQRAGVPWPDGVVLPEPVPAVDRQRFSVALTGIGGTGVVTVNQVLGTAAFRSGLVVQTYDHTGSSQKAGPVVSHLRVLPPGVVGSPTVGSGGADLYLVFDPLVAASGANLAMASPERTVAVVSTTQVPTGEMVADKSKHYPAAALLRRPLDERTRAEHNRYVDAQGLAEALLGDHMASNLLLVGVAVQAGWLPIPAEAIEDAIRLNGTAVDMNLQAFRWGRLHVADAPRVAAALRAASPDRPAAPPPPDADPRIDDLLAPLQTGGELRRVARLRVAELLAYQDAAYAERYVRQLAAVHRAEAACPGAGEALSLAVARQLYKLLAVKDEYEVARLLLDPAERARLHATFGPGVKVRWRLQPTLLRRLGLTRKLELGAGFTPLLWLLRAARRLRGTPLDLLAHTELRRAERAVLQHYEALLVALCERLAPDKHAAAVALAGLPDQLRGYGDVKWRHLRAYVDAMQAQCATLGIELPLPLLPPPQAAQSASRPSAAPHAS